MAKYRQTTPIMFITSVLLLLVYLDDASQLVNLMLETVDAHNGEDIGQAVGNDAQTDYRREDTSRDAEVAKAEEAQDGTADAQDEKRPPLREAHFPVIETLDGDDNALNDDPDCEDYRNGDGRPEDVEQEETTEEDVKQGAQHAGAAVR